MRVLIIEVGRALVLVESLDVNRQTGLKVGHRFKIPLLFFDSKPEVEETWKIEPEKIQIAGRI